MRLLQISDATCYQALVYLTATIPNSNRGSEEGFYIFSPYFLIEKPHIFSAGKHKRLEKSQFEDRGDIGYGGESVFV